MIGSAPGTSRSAPRERCCPRSGHQCTVRLLLPAAWSKTATRTWPVPWLLHGGPGDRTDWTAHTHIEELAAPRDVLAVLPQTSPCSGYSDWYNSGGGGPPAWENLTDELRPLLESGPATW
ncbi:hypothetical protein [Streptomyces sp. R33]|uniref:Esterase n=2 Tax=unclassified Streptomyces TaxID=2593676 RepID=A0AB39XWK7_9ACTN